MGLPYLFFSLHGSWSRYIFIENEEIGVEPGAGWKNGAFSREPTRKSPKSFFMVSWRRVVNFILDVGFRRFARSTAHSRCKAWSFRAARGQARITTDQLKARRNRREASVESEWGEGKRPEGVEGRIREKGFAVARAKRNGRQLISREILLLPLIFRAQLPTVDVRLGKSPYTWIRAERVASDTAFRAFLPRPLVPISQTFRMLLCVSLFAMLRNSRRKFGSDEVLERNVRSI